MIVDYNKFAKSFADSRKNMKWAELEYFFSNMQQGSILDIWCGSGRLLEQYNTYFWKPLETYLWIDYSQWLIQEAQKSFPEHIFLQGDMLDIINIIEWKKFQHIFLIASFHHLWTISQRQKVLDDIYKLLLPNGRVYMTNWALNSELNLQKYETSKLSGTENIYWGVDYSIKIWDNQRFYHCFHIDELDYLAKKSGFKIWENRLFKWDRNIITILEK